MQYKKCVMDIKIDFAKSHGAMLWDKNSGTEFLDFFGMFSSLPVGYNHPVFDASFDAQVARVAKVRMANNLFASDELEAFLTAFRPQVFSEHIHLTCTGALAVESAIKCAMEYKKVPAPMVLACTKSFHGINSWGFITDRYAGTTERMRHHPRNSWQNLDPLAIVEYLRHQDTSSLVAVVVEPIQCTSGDIYIEPELIREIEQLCEQRDVCFIVDEIQTGFGVTGSMWYSERIGVTPDVLVFGKKAQICGIVANEKYSECMTSPHRKLEVTFDGDLIDAIRATYILAAYRQDDLVRRANANAETFASVLRDRVEGYRGVGHLVAFDFATPTMRDQFVRRCFEQQFLCNPTGERSVRLRPHLAVSAEEIEQFASLMQAVLR